MIGTVRVCHRQLSAADLILLTKTDIAEPRQTEDAEALLGQRYPETRVLRAVQGAVPREAVDTLSTRRPAQAGSHRPDLTLQKYALTVSPAMSAEQLRAFLRMFAEDTYRIKGLITLREGTFLADCTGAYVKIEPFDGRIADNRLAVLSGEGMPLRKSLKEALAWYPDLVKEIRHHE